MSAQILAFPTTPTRHAIASINQARNLRTVWQPRCGDWVHDTTTGAPVQLEAFQGYFDRVVLWSARSADTGLTVLRSPHQLRPLHPALWPQGGVA